MHWKNLKNQIFSTTHPRFSTTPKVVKQQNLANTLSKLEQKKKTRAALQPHNLFTQAYFNLRQTPIEKEAKKVMKSQAATRKLDYDYPEKPCLPRKRQMQPEKDATCKEAPNADSFFSQIFRKFDRLQAPMWDRYHKAYVNRRQASLEEKARSWLLKFEAASNTLLIYSDSWLRSLGLLLALEHNFKDIYPVQDGCHYYPLNYIEGTHTSIFDRIRIIAGALLNPPFNSNFIQNHIAFLTISAINFNSILIPSKN